MWLYIDYILYTPPNTRLEVDQVTVKDRLRSTWQCNKETFKTATKKPNFKLFKHPPTATRSFFFSVVAWYKLLLRIPPYPTIVAFVIRQYVCAASGSARRTSAATEKFAQMSKPADHICCGLALLLHIFTGTTVYLATQHPFDAEL